MAPSQGKLRSFPIETPGIDRTGANAACRVICRRASSTVMLLSSNRNVLTRSRVVGRFTCSQSLNVAAGAIVQRRQAAAHDVNAGERHEQHGAGHQADDQPQPGTAQALAIIG